MPTASNTVMLAAAVAGVLAVGTLGWRAVQTHPGPAPQGTAGKPSAGPDHPAGPAGAPEQQTAEATSGASGAPAPTPSAKDAAAPSAARPSFDVVRVEPSGDALVAGRAAPHATVTILNKGVKLAEVTADQTGAFAAIPPALPPGEHLLTLRVSGRDGDVDSEQSVTISVPSAPGSRVVAALTDPDQPTRVLSDPSQPAPGGPQVTIRTVEAGQEGAFFASGVAPAGAPVRLYLNGSFVADVRAGADSTWSLRVEKGMAPGHYEVRADLLEPGSGKVVGRAAVPFDYPVQVAGSGPANRPGAPTASPAAKAPAEASQQAATSPSVSESTPVVAPQPMPAGAAPGDGAPSGTAVVKEIQSVTVQRGDSLWRISRRVLGKGIRYTQIYEANASQIRDPNRIFPGQVLVAPTKTD